jgi:hypothetical protein
MVCINQSTENPIGVMCFDKSVIPNLKHVYDGLFCIDKIGRDGKTKIGRECQYFH